MNSCAHKPLKAATVLWSLIIIGVIVSGCGAGGGSSQSAGIGGTGIDVAKGVVQGRVTGFGSIFVNGDKFNTDASNFIVDGLVNPSQKDLALGMVVTLEVETEDGVFTGKALEVVYDDEVQGPVSATPTDVDGTSGTQKTFMVFGQTVTIDETDTVFEGTSFDMLTVNDVVEISGFRSSPDEIVASYVEWQGNMPDGSVVELRGMIEKLDPLLQQFTLNSFPVTFDNLAVDSGLQADDLANGLFVEVEGLYQEGPPVSVLAVEIEEEDEGFDDEVDDVSLEGPISKYLSIANFKINGQQIDARQASLSPVNAEALLGDGVEVEVEGNIVGGVLMAEELEVEEVETKLKAFVLSIFPGNERFLVNFTGLMGSIEIVTNSQTEFDDNGPLELPNFSVEDMIPGDFVAVEGVESTGKIIAGSVERQDSADPDDSELEGQVDAFVANTSITVLGIPFAVADGTDTQYMDVNGNTSALLFFDNLKMGDRVEIKDKVTADGFAEEVRLDD